MRSTGGRPLGRTGHSGGVFGSELGYGANYELVRILDAVRRELPEPNLTFNVGLMVGGTPATLDAMLRGLPDGWIQAHEGGETWSPFDVIGHLIHGEQTDWVPRRI